MNDPRAYRPHLDGAALLDAEERLLAALLRAPGLWPSAARAGITEWHLQPRHRHLIVQIRTAPEQIKARLATDDRLRRLHNRSVELTQAFTYNLASQIVESIARQPPTHCDTFDDVPLIAVEAAPETRSGALPAIMPVGQEVVTPAPGPLGCRNNGTVVTFSQPCANEPAGLEVDQVERAPDVVSEAPEPAVSDLAEPPSPPSTVDGALSIFLRAVLADGPRSAHEIERLAVEAGLLAASTPIGKARAFRTAKEKLGVTSTQQRGARHQGWFWRLPDQARGGKRP
jgi:hypothetical protein